MNRDFKLKRPFDTMFQSFRVMAFSFRFEYLLKLCIVIAPIFETRKSSLLKSKTCQNAELTTFKQYAYSSNFGSFPRKQVMQINAEKI